jgi:threonine dehydrogenase-like Zn-dependent dehydrogenase
VLILGDYGDARASFRWVDVLHSEIEVIGSNASADAWDEAIALAVEGRLPLSRLITHVIPAHRYAEGLDLAQRRSSGAVKVVLDWRAADVDRPVALGYTLAPSS